MKKSTSKPVAVKKAVATVKTIPTKSVTKTSVKSVVKTSIGKATVKTAPKTACSKSVGKTCTTPIRTTTKKTK